MACRGRDASIFSVIPCMYRNNHAIENCLPFTTLLERTSISMQGPYQPTKTFYQPKLGQYFIATSTRRYTAYIYIHICTLYAYRYTLFRGWNSSCFTSHTSILYCVLPAGFCTIPELPTHLTTSVYRECYNFRTSTKLNESKVYDIFTAPAKSRRILLSVSIDQPVLYGVHGSCKPLKTPSIFFNRHNKAHNSVHMQANLTDSIIALIW